MVAIGMKRTWCKVEDGWVYEPWATRRVSTTTSGPVTLEPTHSVSNWYADMNGYVDRGRWYTGGVTSVG